jgi:hypothetical protein
MKTPSVACGRIPFAFASTRLPSRQRACVPRAERENGHRDWYQGAQQHLFDHGRHSQGAPLRKAAAALTMHDPLREDNRDWYPIQSSLSQQLPALPPFDDLAPSRPQRRPLLEASTDRTRLIGK